MSEIKKINEFNQLLSDYLGCIKDLTIMLESGRVHENERSTVIKSIELLKAGAKSVSLEIAKYMEHGESAK